MPNDSRDARAQNAPLVLPWGVQGGESPDSLAQSAVLWLAGGVVLALWTALAMLLTTA